MPEGLQPAGLEHLVLGTDLYLGDPRRTPARVVAHDPATASFTVRITGFEDKGAEWVLPLWEAGKFLAPPEAATLFQAEQAALSVQIPALNRRVETPCCEETRARSQAEIIKCQREISAWLDQAAPGLPTDAARLISADTACQRWSRALADLMESWGLLQMDEAFAAGYASNPHAGEMVKGHRIVLAELGLCPYEGQVVRDPCLFNGGWSKDRRRAHIQTRLAFMRVLLERFNLPSLLLYRAVSSSSGLTRPRNNGFVSATFSRNTALALFDASRATRDAALFRQKVPGERLFMTFVKTPVLSARLREAEALQLFDRQANVF